MGRSPCCEKVGLKKGPWTPLEDNKLLAYVEEHGHGNWRALPTKAGLQRCGKSCRLRWTNYLRPDIIRGKFSLQEEQTIIQLHALLGNRWSAIATHLPKRTDNEIKNYWNTHLKKKLTKMGIDPVTHKPKNDALLSNVGDGTQSRSASNLSHMAQWESARLEAEARLAGESKLRSNPTQAQTQVINNSNDNLHECIINHPQSSSINNNSSPPPPAATTRYLDVALRAWQHGLGEHSPSSTLNFSESAAGPTNNGALITGGAAASSAIIEFMGINNNINNSPEVIKGDEEDQDDHGMPTFTSGLHEEGNFIEGFTELLLCNFSERNLSSEEGGESGDGGIGGGGMTEDNKSYWNSILNLVNSSPSSSPLF